MYLSIKGYFLTIFPKYYNLLITRVTIENNIDS